MLTEVQGLMYIHVQYLGIFLLLENYRSHQKCTCTCLWTVVQDQKKLHCTSTNNERREGEFKPSPAARSPHTQTHTHMLSSIESCHQIEKQFQGLHAGPLPPSSLIMHKPLLQFQQTVTMSKYSTVNCCYLMV